VKKVLLSLLCFVSLTLSGQITSNLTDITGVWKGAYYQKNFLNPDDSALVYSAVMTVEQHNGEVTGSCYIFWYDDIKYYGKWSMEGIYDGLNFNFNETDISEDNCKPGYSWCYKSVKSFVTYDADTGKWLLKGTFTGYTDYSSCAPGTLIFYKEGDV
jgi:hypothetical protein